MPALRRRARAFLVLTAALALCLAALAASLAGPGAGAPRLAAVAVLGGAVLAALGLLLTWGDPGEPLCNAAGTLAVLLGLVGACTALFLWAASTAGGGW